MQTRYKEKLTILKQITLHALYMIKVITQLLNTFMAQLSYWTYWLE
jgi:hypothetical protein